MKLKGNLCINKGKGSGGGFVPCAGAGPVIAGPARAELRSIIQKIRQDPNASLTERRNAGKLARAELEIANTLKLGDTASRFMGPDGTYIPSRVALHKEIVKKLDNPNAKPQARPTVVMFGGLPGSGKTSSIGASLGMKGGSPKSFAANAVIVDPDAAKKYLPEFNGKNAAVVHRESSHIASTLSAVARIRRQNVILDGTFKDPVKMQGQIDKFKAAGYRVEIRFAELPVAKSRERAVVRFLREGRYVPPSFIQSLSRGKGSKNRMAFEKLKKQADGYLIMDTDVAFGAPAKLIAKKGMLV